MFKLYFYQLIVFLIISISVSGQGKAFFERGTAKLKDGHEVIHFSFENRLPIIVVTIAGEPYRFLFDTGAPVILSNEVYSKLNLETISSQKIVDSQKNQESMIRTFIPELSIGNAVFNDIGAFVMDLRSSDFGCFKLDGIIGSNLMAKLFWRIDYEKNSIEASENLERFDRDGYDMVINFNTEAQKTPKIKSNLLGKKITFTFDTGFNGRLKVDTKYFNPKKVQQSIRTYGISSLGLLGSAKPSEDYIFKTTTLKLDKQTFENEIISTGKSNLIGNDFLSAFSTILDWENKKIYLKKLHPTAKSFHSFGFGYRFIDGNAQVSYTYSDDQVPLHVGDVILQIDNIDLHDLDRETACYFFLNPVERDKDLVLIKIKRDNQVLTFRLKKRSYLN